MINCQQISFSKELQKQRITQAQTILGKKVVQKIICFVLYLLGVDRKSIVDIMDTPPGTIRSIINIFKKVSN